MQLVWLIMCDPQVVNQIIQYLKLKATPRKGQTIWVGVGC
jgi:hypothetical protein